MGVTGYTLPSTTAVNESGEPWLTTRALTHVLVIAGLFCSAVALVLLEVFGGWEYYRAPLATRGYLPAHALLRPSGAVGLTLGAGGVVATSHRPAIQARAGQHVVRVRVVATAVHDRALLRELRLLGQVVAI